MGGTQRDEVLRRFNDAREAEWSGTKSSAENPGLLQNLYSSVRFRPAPLSKPLGVRGSWGRLACSLRLQRFWRVGHNDALTQPRAGARQHTQLFPEVRLFTVLAQVQAAQLLVPPPPLAAARHHHLQNPHL